MADLQQTKLTTATRFNLDCTDPCRHPSHPIVGTILGEGQAGVGG